jgi:hypothetical protein
MLPPSPCSNTAYTLNVISRYNSAVLVGALEGSWILHYAWKDPDAEPAQVPTQPKENNGGGGGGLRQKHNCRKFPEWRILMILSFWISFCEFYILLCSLTSEPFAIATELAVNHTLSFVENFKNSKFLHARQN